MIVNWKKDKAGVLVVPLMKDGIVIGKKVLIPGYNQISDAEWEQMSFSLASKIEKGQLVKVVTKRKITTTSNVLPIPEDPDYFPFNEILAVLKTLDLVDQLTSEKKIAEKGNGVLSKKWLKEKFEKDPDLKARVFAQISVGAGEEPVNETKEIEIPLTIKEMPASQAVEIIAETYDINTLNEWLKKEGRDEVRAAISNQLEELHKEPTKEKKGIFGKKE